MKLEITQRKVFAAAKPGEKEQEVPVGTVIDVKEFPGHLIGKARIVGEPGAAAQLVVNIDELRARFEEVVGRKPDPKAKPETLQKAIAEAEAQKLAELRKQYFDLTGKTAIDALDAAALTAVISDLTAPK